MLGFTVLRFAPGTPEQYFSQITSSFVCSSGLNVTDSGANLTYCSTSMFNLETVNFIENITGSLSIPCDYGDGPKDLTRLCEQNTYCMFGSIKYFQVSLNERWNGSKREGEKLFYFLQ